MNTATLTRDELRKQIDTMEALDSVLSAIDELSGLELERSEPPEVDITLFDRTMSKAPITTASAIPYPVAFAGLRAMQRMLEQMLLKDAE